MKFKSTLLTALFGLSAACAPVDNDDTAAVKSQNSTLHADTMLEMINNGPFDAHRFPAFNTHLAAADERPGSSLASALDLSDDLKTTMTENETMADAADLIQGTENEDDQPATPSTPIEPDAQDVGHGECFALGFGGGTSGRILDSKPINLDYNKGITIEGWIRIDNDQGVILSKKSSPLDPYWTIDYDHGALRFSLGSDASHLSVYAAQFPAGEWFHFAITRGENVAGGAEIFINGIKETEQLEYDADSLSIHNAAPITIGQDVDSGLHNFHGSLASLHIAEGVWYADDFDVADELETVETTFGAWTFTQPELDGAVENNANDEYDIRLRGPIYTEHTPVCPQ